MKPENVHFDNDSVVRVAALVGILVVHFAAFVFISLPASPPQRRRAAGRALPAKGHLIVRLVDVHAPTENPAETVFRVRGPALPKATHREHAATSAMPRAQAHRDRKRASRPLDLSLPGMGRSKGAVVGRMLGRARPGLHPRLPGGGHVHGAPRIELVDPRTQGVAGVVRTIQGLFGVVNRHCVDVDSWRGMTREERFEHHITDRQVQRTAEYYGCKPRKQGDLH